MLYFKVDRNDRGRVVEVSEEHQPRPGDYLNWINRNSFTRRAAISVAEEANALNDGHHYLASDEGPNVYPRFDVIRAPALGDKVSYAFNGDSYPDGEIIKISPTFKVIATSTGSRYYRRGHRSSWVKDGTWSLVIGHVYKQNPSF